MLLHHAVCCSEGIAVTSAALQGWLALPRCAPPQRALLAQQAASLLPPPWRAPRQQPLLPGVQAASAAGPAAACWGQERLQQQQQGPLPLPRLLLCRHGPVQQQTLQPTGARLGGAPPQTPWLSYEG